MILISEQIIINEIVLKLLFFITLSLSIQQFMKEIYFFKRWKRDD